MRTCATFLRSPDGRTTPDSCRHNRHSSDPAKPIPGKLLNSQTFVNAQSACVSDLVAGNPGCVNIFSGTMSGGISLPPGDYWLGVSSSCDNCASWDYATGVAIMRLNQRLPSRGHGRTMPCGACESMANTVAHVHNEVAVALTTSESKSVPPASGDTWSLQTRNPNQRP